jgi:hypothetical protein
VEGEVKMEKCENRCASSNVERWKGMRGRYDERRCRRISEIKDEACNHMRMADAAFNGDDVVFAARSPALANCSRCLG